MLTMLASVAGNSRNGSADVTPAMPHGRLRYDIHARFDAGRCASAVLIVVARWWIVS